MSRPTSIEAYRKIKENGLLSRARQEVYEILYSHGPMTANDVARHMKKLGNSSPTVHRNAHARLTELRDLGCVVEMGTKVDSETGMNVILWVLTDQLPESTNDDKIDRVLASIDRYERLKDKALERLRKLANE